MEKMLLSFAETCKALDISRNTLYALIAEKKIHGFKIGNVWKFSTEELKRFIDEQMDASKFVVLKSAAER